MPAQDKKKTLIRCMQLIRELPTHGPGKTSQELTEILCEKGFDVTRRTVERNLLDLKEAFPNSIRINKGLPQGWLKHGNFDLLGMSLEDALALSLVEKSVTPLLPKAQLKTLQLRFEEASSTIEQLAGSNEYAVWAGKVRSVLPTLPMLAPQIDEQVFEQIQSALLKAEQVDVVYLAAGASEPKTMPLNPLGLVQRGPVIYLVATAYDYTRPVLFALHRIKSARRTYLPLPDSVEALDLDAYIASGSLQFGDDESHGEEIQLQASLSEALAHILGETPLAGDQKITKGQAGWQLTATVRDTLQLKWWILSQGAGVEVLAPESFRARIRMALREAADRYA